LHFNTFFLACPVEPTRCGATQKKEKEHINVEIVVYLKTETKPFTQNVYLWHFLEEHLSSLHSRLTQESPKTCQVNGSSTYIFEFKAALTERLRVPLTETRCFELCALFLNA